jgi:alkylation response protein AidB-like acyl-CoA dehydrogenase
MKTNERERRSDYLDRMHVYRLVQAVMRTMREEVELAEARERRRAWKAQQPQARLRVRRVYAFVERESADEVTE